MVNGAQTSYHHGDLQAALRQTAWEIIAENGPNGVSLRECARRVGVSHAAPAHHFGSLSGLLAEVAADGYARLVATIDESKDDKTDELMACGLGYVRFAQLFPNHFRLMMSVSKSASERPRLTESRLLALDRLRGSLREIWIRIHSVAPAPELLDTRTALAWSAAHGYASLSLDYPRSLLALPPAEQVFAPLYGALLRP